MKVISVSDLKLVDSLKHLNIFEIIAPQFDHLVLPVLEEIGFDLSYPLQYDVNYHRNWQGKAHVGFRISGEININEKYLRGQWASMEDRMIGNSYVDRSLQAEMMALQNTQKSYETIHSYDSDESREIQNILENYMDKSFTEKIEQEMEVMNKILFDIRGDQRLKSGAYKLSHQYFEEEVVPKERKKKKNRKFKISDSN